MSTGRGFGDGMETRDFSMCVSDVINEMPSIAVPQQQQQPVATTTTRPAGGGTFTFEGPKHFTGSITSSAALSQENLENHNTRTKKQPRAASSNFGGGLGARSTVFDLNAPSLPTCSMAGTSVNGGGFNSEVKPLKSILIKDGSRSKPNSRASSVAIDEDSEMKQKWARHSSRLGGSAKKGERAAAPMEGDAPTPVRPSTYLMDSNGHQMVPAPSIHYENQEDVEIDSPMPMYGNPTAGNRNTAPNKVTVISPAGTETQRESSRPNMATAHSKSASKTNNSAVAPIFDAPSAVTPKKHRSAIGGADATPPPRSPLDRLSNKKTPLRSQTGTPLRSLSEEVASMAKRPNRFIDPATERGHTPTAARLMALNKAYPRSGSLRTTASWRMDDGESFVAFVQETKEKNDALKPKPPPSVRLPRDSSEMERALNDEQMTDAESNASSSTRRRGGAKRNNNKKKTATNRISHEDEDEELEADSVSAAQMSHKKKHGGLSDSRSAAGSASSRRRDTSMALAATKSQQIAAGGKKKSTTKQLAETTSVSVVRGGGSKKASAAGNKKKTSVSSTSKRSKRNREDEEVEQQPRTEFYNNDDEESYQDYEDTYQEDTFDDGAAFTNQQDMEDDDDLLALQEVQTHLISSDIDTATSGFESQQVGGGLGKGGASKKTAAGSKKNSSAASRGAGKKNNNRAPSATNSMDNFILNFGETNNILDDGTGGGQSNRNAASSTSGFKKQQQPAQTTSTTTGKKKASNSKSISRGGASQARAPLGNLQNFQTQAPQEVPTTQNKRAGGRTGGRSLATAVDVNDPMAVLFNAAFPSALGDQLDMMQGGRMDRGGNAMYRLKAPKTKLKNHGL